MRPTLKKKHRIVLTWAAAVTSLAMVLSTGATYGRVIDWTSAELIFTPAASAGYSSNCLSADGQQILLSDWQANESQRTVTISVSRPAPEPVETVPPTQTDATEPENEELDATEVTEPSEETVPDASEDTNPTETESTEPEETEGTTPDAIQEVQPAAEDPVTGEPEDTDTTETTNTTEAAEETEPMEDAEAAEETDNTEGSEPVEGAESTEDPDTEEETEPETTPETEPEITWTQDEVIVTLDETTAEHLICTTLVGEDSIQILLERREDTPGLLQTTALRVDIEWFGLKGTICVNMLPYGAAAVSPVDEAEETRQIVTGLTPVLVNDTINPDNPVSCVILNLETLSDFSITFMQGSDPLYKVWWSLDGESYTLLYDSFELTLTWPYTEGWTGAVYLNFSDALEDGQRPTIVVEATGYSLQEFTPVLLKVPEASELILKAANLPYTIAINPTWGAARLQVTQIQRLVTDEEGSLSYAEDTSLCASITDSGILLTPAVADIYPAPGSYRMTVCWIWNETVVEEQIIYFFVNTN